MSWLVAHKYLGPTHDQVANVDPQLTRHEREVQSTPCAVVPRPLCSGCASLRATNSD